MLRAFVNCAKEYLTGHWPWRNGVSKTPLFLHFQVAIGN
jgi:hypothetical protein